ncbi:hypothetical protein ACSBR2_016285 [Camellia fascicularis]
MGNVRNHQEPKSDDKSLNYLKLVIKETLRLHPPAPLLLPKECREEYEINGYKIPLKTKVIVNTWALGKDLEYWHDVESFSPERFEDGDVDFVGTKFQYISFGAGRRMCPASFVSIVVLFLLETGLHMTESFGTTTRRKRSLCLIRTPYSLDDDDQSC